MTHTHFTLTVQIAAPFFSAGIGHSLYGHDISLYRTWDGKIAISGDQLRGVAREWLIEGVNKDSIERSVLEQLFGRKGGTYFGDPADDPRRRLDIGDLELSCVDGNLVRSHSPSTRTETRIEIDDVLGTVKPGHLIVYESPFSDCSKLTFSGLMRIATTRDSDPDHLAKWIVFAIEQTGRLGLRKSAGAGRLIAVSATKAKSNKTQPVQLKKFNTTSATVTMRLDRPLLADPIVSRGNQLVSKPYLPGSMIMGALHAHRLDVSTLLVTHARPVDDKGSYTPLQSLPQDMFLLNGKVNSFTKNPSPSGRITHVSDFKPAVFCDAAKLAKLGPEATYWTKTRTAIGRDGTAADGQLFSQALLTPARDLSFRITASNAETLKAAIKAITDGALATLGKMQARAKNVRVSWPSPQPSVQEGNIRVLLTSDAALLSPDMTQSVSLEEAYSEYFKSCFEDVKLTDYYTTERWVPHRGRAKFSEHGYTPILLTEAGSVFILSGLKKKFIKILQQGLPAGLQIIDKDKCDVSTHAHSPFVRENGYGEVELEAVQ